MTISKYLRILLLALYWKLPSAKGVDFSQVTEVSKELNHRKEKRKRLNKRRDRLPLKQKKLFRHQGYKNTKSKDPRFSNQRKLRRMYRGV
jgi:hypothetical protein